MNNSKSIFYNKTIGIIGGGQLGQMLAHTALSMSYRVAILDPDPNAPAKKYAFTHIVAEFTDKEALHKLATISDVITLEFENIPVDSLIYLEQHKPLYPSAHIIKIAQNRLLEKEFFNSLNIDTTEFYPIRYHSDIDNIQNNIFPAILKTTTLGYDGKGQIRVHNKNELISAFNALNHQECILEKLINLKLETSVIVARNQSETQVYEINENIHINGILDTTIAPARIDEDTKTQLQKYAIQIINKLEYIGVLVVEFFITEDNKILANEMAPRPHNSGHHTIESTITSQFEQHIRAICNLKLGDTRLHTKAIMLNILGDSYQNNELTQLEAILLKFSNLKLHLYDKLIAKQSRKMGHITLLNEDYHQLLFDVTLLKNLLL